MVRKTGRPPERGMLRRSAVRPRGARCPQTLSNRPSYHPFADERAGQHPHQALTDAPSEYPTTARGSTRQHRSAVARQPVSAPRRFASWMAASVSNARQSIDRAHPHRQSGCEGYKRPQRPAMKRARRARWHRGRRTGDCADRRTETRSAHSGKRRSDERRGVGL
jgi:hypothetical protein